MRVLFLLLFSTFVLSLTAQRKGMVRRKTTKTSVQPATPPLTPEECIRNYSFTQAATLYRTAMEHLTAPAQRDSLEQRAKQCERAEALFDNCDRIAFIDSLVFDKDALFSTLPFSSDAGQLVPTAPLFQGKDLPNTQLGVATYINPLRSAAYFSAAVGALPQRLYTSFSSSGIWSAPAPLEGIADSIFLAPDFPFLLTDGITLYFAAKGRESIGGYDLFATRYNPDTHRYVHPTNVGMPFNSPDNDYLLAIDSRLNLGYLLTDRRQPEGKVCLYTFLPQPDHTQLSDTLSRETRVAHAQIASIGLTQLGLETFVAEAQKRRTQAISPTTTPTTTFAFVMGDDKIYRQLDDFRSPEARRLAEQWVSTHSQQLNIAAQHATLQARYARSRSQDLVPQLQQCETQLRQLRTQLRRLAQQIRKAEATFVKP